MTDQPKKNPHATMKRQARRSVRTALKNGSLTRLTCESCGSKAQAHHDDYAKPLEVRWLCPKHHMALHRDAIPENSGERNGMTKLTAEQVRNIRDLYAAGEGNQYTLATRFGISQSQTWKILHNLRWTI